MNYMIDEIVGGGECLLHLSYGLWCGLSKEFVKIVKKVDLNTKKNL